MHACCFAGNHDGRDYTDCTPAAPLGCLVCEGVYQMLPDSRYQYLCVHLSPCLIVLYTKGLLHFLLLLLSLQRRGPENVLSDLSTFAAIVFVL